MEEEPQKKEVTVLFVWLGVRFAYATLLIPKMRLVKFKVSPIIIAFYLWICLIGGCESYFCCCCCFAESDSIESWRPY